MGGCEILVGVVVMGHDFEVVWEICTSVVDGGRTVRGNSGWRNYWNDFSLLLEQKHFHLSQQSRAVF